MAWLVKVTVIMQRATNSGYLQRGTYGPLGFFGPKVTAHLFPSYEEARRHQPKDHTQIPRTKGDHAGNKMKEMKYELEQI